MFQAALRPQALKCSVARTLQASEEARVTAAAKLFPGMASAADGPRPHTTGRPAVLRGLTTGSSFDGA